MPLETLQKVIEEVQIIPEVLEQLVAIHLEDTRLIEIPIKQIEIQEALEQLNILVAIQLLQEETATPKIIQNQQRQEILVAVQLLQEVVITEPIDLLIVEVQEITGANLSEFSSKFLN